MSQFFDIFEIVEVPLLTIYIIAYIPTITIFMMRRNIEPIASRGWELVLLQSIVSVYVFFSLAIDSKFLNSCYPVFISQGVLIPLLGFPYFFRSWSLWFNYYYGLGLLKVLPQKDFYYYHTHPSSSSSSSLKRNTASMASANAPRK